MARNVYKEKVEPYLDMIRGWARDGLVLEDIAHNLKITRQTLSKYAKAKNKDGSWKYEILHEYLKEGKEIADYRVENALFKCATGYHTTEEKIVKTDGGVELVEVRTYHPPSVTAQIFWLKNRKQDKWRDKVIPEEVKSELMDMLMIGARNEEDSMETTAETVSLSEPNRV